MDRMALRDRITILDEGINYANICVGNHTLAGGTSLKNFGPISASDFSVA